MEKQTKEKIVIGIVGDPDSGKSIIASYLKQMIKIYLRQYIEANVDGEGVVGDAPDQNFINVIKRRGKLTSALPKKVNSIIEGTESPIVIADIGGLACYENAQILTCCDYCIMVNKDDEGQKRWREFIESLKPGKQVRYVERIGTQLGEKESTEGIKISEKDGVKYKLEDVERSMKYEELTLGHKSPKIILEIDSRLSKDNPDLKNSVKEDEKSVKATLLDLQHGLSNKIDTSIDFLENKPYIFVEKGEEDLFITVGRAFLLMLSRICDEVTIDLSSNRDRKTDKESDPMETLKYIANVKSSLKVLDFLTKRVKYSIDFPYKPLFEPELFFDFNYEQNKLNIRDSMKAIKPLFVIGEGETGEQILDFYRIAHIIGNSERIEVRDMRKLIFLYDILLDDKPNEAILYGSRLLLSSAAFVEEAKKDGISTVKIHSASYDSYIECEKLNKSGKIQNGVEIAGMTYYVEKNEKCKTAIIHMIFDDSLRPEKIRNIVLPEIPSDYKIYFSGIIPDWFIGSLTMSYDNSEKAIMKPDLEGKHLITYASRCLKNVGLIEDNPPGIDVKDFFARIPDVTHTFKDAPKDSLATDSIIEGQE